MNCPSCGYPELENISGDYETGVVAPDGYRETLYEQGYCCLKCKAVTDDRELGLLAADGNDPEFTRPA